MESTYSGKEHYGFEGDESSTDDGKRKRDGKEETPFAKSKKLSRSPLKKSTSEKEIKKNERDELKELVMQVMSELREMKKGQKEMSEKLEVFTSEITNLREENSELRSRLKKMEETVERNERFLKKNNVIVKGIKLNSNIKETEKFFKEKLGADIKVKSVQSWASADKQKDISVVQVNSWDEKESLMKNKYKLKGSQIYVDRDLTKCESEIQKKLRDRAKLEREKGHSANVGYQKIFINGICWTWSMDKNDVILKN